ncbi:MAG: M23 family metallopeptidase [Planctomycetota bacterium]
MLRSWLPVLLVSAALAAPASAQPTPSTLLQFWPQAGAPGQDLECTKYFTHNQQGEATDYRCGGIISPPFMHYGTDALLRSFREQAAGVPIFAARSGCVETAEDRYCDMCVTTGAQPLGCTNPGGVGCIVGTSNTVTIGHGNELFTLYTHLKKDSIPDALKPTSSVPRPCVYAGEMIGETASSGASGGPHLHFEVFTTAFGRFDPFGTPTFPGGICVPPTQDYWETTPAFAYDTVRIWDVTISNDDLTGVKFPAPAIGNGHLSLSGMDQEVHVWFMLLFGRNKNVTARYRLRSPLGATYGFGPAAPVPVNSRIEGVSKQLGLGEIPLYAGLWTILITVQSDDGTVVVNAPLEISGEAATNSAPRRPTTVALTPTSPTDEDVLFCAVTMPIVDDPDYDLVQYEYVWENTSTGTSTPDELRRVTHAGQGDALSCNQIETGMTVRVTVTAVDPSGARSPSRIAGPVSINEDPSERCACACESGDATLGRWHAFDLAPNAPRLHADGGLRRGSDVRLHLAGPPLGRATVLLGPAPPTPPLRDGGLWPAPAPHGVMVALDAHGHGTVQLHAPASLEIGAAVVARAWVVDPAGAASPRATNSLRARAR